LGKNDSTEFLSRRRKVTGYSDSNPNLKALKRYGISFLAVILCMPVFGQQTGITGRVTDPSSALVANVTVTATAEDGTKVTAATNADGLYQFPGLRAGDYRLRFDVAGFAPAERTVTLLVGQMATVDLTLQLAQAATAVSVEALANAVDTTSSTVAGDVSPTEVQKVPLNGRNYLQLAMLVPGITSNDVQTSVLGGTDIGKMQINVDGQQVTQTSAATSFGEPLYSEEAIDQYQIITNRFDATMGRSGRVQVIVQTKSGTNNFHGSLFGYFRNSDFNAADPVAHKVLPFSDQQFGGSVGGPIVKNKLFFFFAYEGERQPNTIFDQPTDYTSLSGQQLAFTFSNTLNTRTYLLHMDYQISNTQRLSVTGSGSTWAEPAANLSGTSAPTRVTDATRTSYAVIGNWTWTVTPALVNSAKIGFNHYDWSNNALLSTQEYRFSEDSWGSPYNYPQLLAQNIQQYHDDVFWLRGGHSLKFGVDFQHIPYTGNFGQNVRGTVLSFASGVNSIPLIDIFPVWNQPSTWNLSLMDPYVTQFTQGFGNYIYSVPTQTVGGWFQDDWKVSRKLTLNLGLRYDNDLGIFNPNLYLKTGYPTPHNNPDLMFQPRLGFTYDPTGARKTVIRGGAGLFYSYINANYSIDGNIFNGQNTLSPALTPTAANPINLANPWNGVTGAQFLSGQVPVSTQAVQLLDTDVRTPYSFQGSIGVQQQITRDWSMTADYVHFRVYHDWITIDGNLYENPATGYPLAPSTYGRPFSYYAGIRDFATPNAVGQLYDGLQVGIQHRFSQSFSGNIAYTLERFKDSADNSTPNNPFNLGAEWGPSADQQRNTLSATGVYSFKWGIALSGALHYGSGQNFGVSSNQNPFGLTYYTSRIFTNTTPFYINPADVTAAPGLPGYGIVARDSFVGQPIIRIDMRLSKTFIVKDRFHFTPMIEAFNLFNHANFGSYQTTVTVASFGLPAQNSDLPYFPRMLQFAGRFEF
jgi:hypothetical protein